tara:strand:+ start:8985 stop:13775 length:4791 start_codon:yes stop_codon:yes gene_type:complete
MKNSNQDNNNRRHIERWRNITGNDMLGATEEEAMSYARKMGLSDSLRGITQILGETFNWDETVEDLKKDDRRLQKILDNEEYGTKAMANFIGSAALLDPLNLVPVAGLMAKANKLRHIVTYGAGIGGVYGSLGYVSRDNPGLFAENQNRIENAAIGAAAGGVLGGIAGGAGHLINRMRGRPSPLDPDNVSSKATPKQETAAKENEIDVSRRQAEKDRAQDFPLDPTLETTKPVTIPKFLTRDQEKNITVPGKTIDFTGRSILDDTDILEPATPITRNYRAMKPYNKGEWVVSSNIDNTRTQEIIDTSTGLKTETFFDYTGKQISSPQYAYDLINPNASLLKNERELYRVQKIQDEWQILRISQNLDKDGDIVGKETVLSELFKEQGADALFSGRFASPYKARQHVNYIIRRQRILNSQDKAGSSDLINDIKRVESRASNQGQNPKTASDEVISKRLGEEIDEATSNPASITKPVENFYQRIAGDALKNYIFNFWGTSFSAAGGGIYGYNSSNNPNATVSQRMADAALWSMGAGASVNMAGRLRVMTGNETWGEFMSSMVVNDYGLSQKYKDRRYEGLVGRNQIMQDFQGLLIPIARGLTPVENRMLHNIMTGDFPSLNKLEDEFGKLSPQKREELDIFNAEKRRLIKKYGQEMVDLSLLDEEVFNKNLDTYVHRTYRKHLKSNKKGDPTFQTGLRKLTLIGDEFKPRGLEEKISYTTFFDKEGKIKQEYLDDGFELLKDLRETKKIAPTTWDREFKKILAGESSKYKDYDFVREVRHTDDPKKDKVLIRKKTGQVLVRRQWTKEERVKWGEIEDASYAIGETGRLMAHDISMSKFFNTIAEDIDENNLKFAVTKEQLDNLDEATQALYSVVPETKIKGTSNIYAYGKLGKDKMYVQTPILNDLKNMLRLKETQDARIAKFAKGVEGLTTTWKKLKTAWIPAVHVNNTISNVGLLDLSGTQISLLPKAALEFSKAIRDPENASRLAKDAKLYGVYDVDIVSKEFGNDIANAFEETFKKETDQFLPEDVLGFTGLVGKALNKVKNLTIKKAERAYQFEDHVFRYTVFKDRVNKMGGIDNISEAQKIKAAQEARKWFIDYDINAPLINWMRRYPTPFLSYTYRVIPLIAEAAVMRPHKFAKWALAGYMLNQAGQKFGEGNQEAERLTARDELSRTLYDVPFMPPTLVKMPFRSAYGDSQYLDVSRWVPGGDIYEQREQGVPGLPSPFQPSFGIWGDLWNTFAVQKDAYTGQDIEGVGTDDLALIKDFARKMIPNIPVVPGSYAWDRRQIANNLQKGYEVGKVEGIEGDVLKSVYTGSPYGANYSPLEAWLYGFGVKLRPQNIHKNRLLKEFEYTQQRREIDRKYSDARTDLDRGRIDFEELQSIFNQADEDILRLEAEWQSYNSLLSKYLYPSSSNESTRQRRVTGGLIKGEDVPFAKEDPATRINPLTGEPYVEEGLLEALQRRQEDRILMNRGGLLSTLKKRRQSYKDGDEVKGGDPVSTDRDKSMRGFLGPIVSNVTGKTHTELSVTFEDVLGGRPIPLLVPTLTEEDQDWFRENNAEGNPRIVPDSIKQKAIIHALERDKQGLDPFYQDGEDEQR